MPLGIIANLISVTPAALADPLPIRAMKSFFKTSALHSWIMEYGHVDIFSVKRRDSAH